MTSPALSTRDDSVRRAIIGGLTMSEVAGRFGLTRNQVAGIIDRLRRKGALPPAGTRQASGAISGKRAKAAADKKWQEIQAKKAEKLAKAAEKNAAKAANADRDFNSSTKAQPLSARLLTNFDPIEGVEPVPYGSSGCKYPVDGIDGPGLLWCGADKQPGEVYCLAHCRIAYTPPKPRRAA